MRITSYAPPTRNLAITILVLVVVFVLYVLAAGVWIVPGSLTAVSGLVDRLQPTCRAGQVVATYGCQSERTSSSCPSGTCYRVWVETAVGCNPSAASSSSANGTTVTMALYTQCHFALGASIPHLLYDPRAEAELVEWYATNETARAWRRGDCTFTCKAFEASAKELLVPETTTVVFILGGFAVLMGLVIAGMLLMLLGMVVRPRGLRGCRYMCNHTKGLVTTAAVRGGSHVQDVRIASYMVKGALPLWQASNQVPAAVVHFSSAAVGRRATPITFEQHATGNGEVPASAVAWAESLPLSREALGVVRPLLQATLATREYGSEEEEEAGGGGGAGAGAGAAEGGAAEGEAAEEEGQETVLWTGQSKSACCGMGSTEGTLMGILAVAVVAIVVMYHLMGGADMDMGSHMVLASMVLIILPGYSFIFTYLLYANASAQAPPSSAKMPTVLYVLTSRRILLIHTTHSAQRVTFGTCACAAARTLRCASRRGGRSIASVHIYELSYRALAREWRTATDAQAMASCVQRCCTGCARRCDAWCSRYDGVQPAGPAGVRVRWHARCGGCCGCCRRRNNLGPGAAPAADVLFSRVLLDPATSEGGYAQFRRFGFMQLRVQDAMQAADVLRQQMAGRG